MTFPLFVCIATCAAMILCVLFKPQFNIFGRSVSSYWVVVLLGATLLVVCGSVKPGQLAESFFSDSAINPLKILVLFISMTLLSIFLDEMGFFRYLAGKTLAFSGKSQTRLFIILYAVVSVLTVFTSNDIIVLTFTPFICYFAKNAGIRPLPYLVNVFVAANTWSMALIIGNPTNIYLATFNGIDFIAYLKYMILPTLAAGVTAFVLLLIIFRKNLSEPINAECECYEIKDKLLLTVGIVHLSVCTLLLAVGSYIDLEMWLVAFVSAISLILFNAVISAARRRRPTQLFTSLRRAPWALIPFVLSMFVLIIAFTESGMSEKINSLIGHNGTIMKYGITSFLSANLINNIPMSVLFCSIIDSIEGLELTKAIFSVVIGSNIGAFLTPIGALAGVMWSSMLKEQGIKFGYGDFLKYGSAISIPTIAAALGVLALVIG